MSGNFEKTNLDWQFQLLQMRIAEWLDRAFAPSNPEPNNLPNWTLPAWFLQSGFWTITALLLVWVVWQLYVLLWPYIRSGRLRRRGQRHPQDLTTAVVLTGSQWLQRSRTLAQQGNYREACRALYLATLQKLHDRNLIPNQLSRTDGEYLRILQTLPQPQPYQRLFHTHERLCFSDADISQDTFQACERAYREIETT